MVLLAVVPFLGTREGRGAKRNTRSITGKLNDSSGALATWSGRTTITFLLYTITSTAIAGRIRNPLCPVSDSDFYD